MVATSTTTSVPVAGARARFRAAHGFSPRTASLAEAEDLVADLEEKLVAAVNELADTEDSVFATAHAAAAWAMDSMRRSNHPSTVVGLGSDNLDKIASAMQDIASAQQQLLELRSHWSIASLEASCWRGDVATAGGAHPSPDRGHVDEETPGEWRWHCSGCPTSSVGTYPTRDAALAGMDRHDEVAEVMHR